MTDIKTLEELKEKLAAIEHERWADWQKWCHQVIRENGPNLQTENVLMRWDRQIETPYAELSEKEKQSDREQVDRYLPLINLYIEERERLARISELKQIEPPEQYEDYAILMGSKHCRICGFNAIKFREHIQDRIKELE